MASNIQVAISAGVPSSKDGSKLHAYWRRIKLDGPLKFLSESMHGMSPLALCWGGSTSSVWGIGVLKLYMLYKIGFYATRGVPLDPPSPRKGRQTSEYCWKSIACRGS